jgi:serine protease Do
MPAVVSITTTEPPEADSQDQGPQQGVGAGFLLSSDGYILTSAHVIDSATAVKVTVLSPSGRPEDYPARVVGVDEDTDFALLKIRTHRKLPHLKLGSSKDVDVADWLVVIGSPFGLARSVSVGVVSYKGRTDVTPNGRDGYFDYLQTDAAINPGNSGGPILDLSGHVVAIANAVNVAGQGIGFAVPVDIAKAVLPDLRRLGHVRRGWMGVSVEDLSPERARSLAVRGGVVVSAIAPGSPAEKAGLKVGDVITQLDHRSIDRATALRFRLGRERIGREVALGVSRAGVPFTVGLLLSEQPVQAQGQLADATTPAAPAKADR